METMASPMWRLVGFHGSGVSLHTATVPQESVPGFMKGSNRAAMRVALNEFDEGRSANSKMRIS